MTCNSMIGQLLACRSCSRHTVLQGCRTILRELLLSPLLKVLSVMLGRALQAVDCDG
jgi:hypothetical protein